MSDLSDKLAALLMAGKDVAQGASNAIAGNVSGPVDALAWGLRKAGLGNVIGPTPVGGSDWMAQQGLTRQPTNALAGGAGETMGLLSPLAWAKAPQIAGGLLRMGENAAAPTNGLLAQRGVIDVNALKAQFPTVDLNLSQSGNVATLGKVVVPAEQRGEGLGSALMRKLTEAADADGATVALTPSSDFGGNKARLVDFYKRFGFVPNKGRNIDFTLSESMYRAPKE